MSANWYFVRYDDGKKIDLIPVRKETLERCNLKPYQLVTLRQAHRVVLYETSAKIVRSLIERLKAEADSIPRRKLGDHLHVMRSYLGFLGRKAAGTKKR